jgi:hypothetical protein
VDLFQEEEERQARLVARDRLHELEANYYQAGRCLSRLLHGGRERYRGEESLCWWYLSNLLPRIRAAEARYYQLARLGDADVF